MDMASVEDGAQSKAARLNGGSKKKLSVHKTVLERKQYLLHELPNVDYVIISSWQTRLTRWHARLHY